MACTVRAGSGGVTAGSFRGPTVTEALSGKRDAVYHGVKRPPRRVTDVRRRRDTGLDVSICPNDQLAPSADRTWPTLADEATFRAHAQHERVHLLSERQREAVPQAVVTIGAAFVPEQEADNRFRCRHSSLLLAARKLLAGPCGLSEDPQAM